MFKNWLKEKESKLQTETGYVAPGAENVAELMRVKVALHSSKQELANAKSAIMQAQQSQDPQAMQQAMMSLMGTLDRLEKSLTGPVQ